MRTLIVDDSFLYRKLIVDVIRDYGLYDVACDGREAMHALELSWNQNTPYQLITLDVDMPKASGREVLNFLRKREEEQGIHLGQGAKVIMMTSHKDADTFLGSFRDGCESYLAKPISAAKVRRELIRLELLCDVRAAATVHV
jgi:two-component system chemotaxis response regulator CheY